METKRPRGYKGKRRGTGYVPDTRNYAGKHESGSGCFTTVVMMVVGMAIIVMVLASVGALDHTWPTGVNP